MNVLGRVHREVVNGEVVGVRLDLVRDEDMVELHEGDEFVTVELKVDPWQVKS